jgi:hypothetical protein
VSQHWPKVQKWQGVGSMIDALLGLLQQSPPQAETKFSRSLLDDIQSESLLGENKLAPRPKEKPIQLAPRPKEKPTSRAMNGSLQEIATMVANDDKVPVDFIINEVINPIAYHESDRTMDPLTKQKGGGPGRGLLQFEGQKGVLKKNKKTGKLQADSFDVALNRASRYFTNKGMQIPSWVTDVQPGQDATSLTGDQQKALAILNFKGMANRPNKIKANFGKLYEKFQGPGRSDYNESLGEFWKTYHHRKAGEDSKTTLFKQNLSKYNMAGELDLR